MTILYIDPGAGSLFFQAILSGILALIVYFNRIRIYIKNRFFRNKNKND